MILSNLTLAAPTIYFLRAASTRATIYGRDHIMNDAAKDTDCATDEIKINMQSGALTY